MESMQQIIKHVTNEIIDPKKNKGEGKKPFNPFLKNITNTNTPPLSPSTLGVNLEDYSMENFFRTHHINHSERTFPKFINSFTTMILP